MTVQVQTAQSTWTYTLLRSLVMTTIGAVALALLSQVRIPLPYTPVPVTLQVFGVLMLGGLLGPRLGALAVAEYLLMGLAGLPVFTHGAWGIGVFAGATGGYLIGFVPAAVVVGLLYARLEEKPYAQRLWGGMLACLAGVLIIYAGGWAWLTGLLHSQKALQMAYLLGILPFIGIDLVKSAATAAVLALRRNGVS
ncbi:MAG: biotin transporter BioY [Armatimonadota bacterium]